MAFAIARQILVLKPPLVWKMLENTWKFKSEFLTQGFRFWAKTSLWIEIQALASSKTIYQQGLQLLCIGLQTFMTHESHRNITSIIMTPQFPFLARRCYAFNHVDFLTSESLAKSKATEIQSYKENLRACLKTLNINFVEFSVKFGVIKNTTFVKQTQLPWRHNTPIVTSQKGGQEDYVVMVHVVAAVVFITSGGRDVTTTHLCHGIWYIWTNGSDSLR